MTDLDLCYISAVDAIAAFKARKLSPVELMQAVIARPEAVYERAAPMLDWANQRPNL